MLSDIQAQEIMIADALRYAARYRREGLALGQHRTPRSSKDNVGIYDGHQPNTYRPMPRTAYSNPDAGEGTSSNMMVTRPDGSRHIVPAVPTWRRHLRQPRVIADTQPETARRGGSQAEYD